MDENNKTNLAEGWTSFDIYNNKEFVDLYGKYRNTETCKICGNQVVIFKIPIFGYLLMRVYLSKNVEIDKFLQESLDICSQKKIPKIEIVTTPTKVLNKYPYQQEGTYIIDLNQSSEKLLSNLQGKTRQNLRKAEKKRVVIQQTNDLKDFDGWWEIYESTGKRGGFVLQQYDFVADLFKNGNISQLFIASVNGKIANGAFLLISKYPVYWLGASLPEFWKFETTSLMQWKIIEWSKKMNFAFYDMGGAVKNAEHGPTEFKRHFGGEFRDIYTYKIEINKIKSNLIDAAVKLRYMLKKSH